MQLLWELSWKLSSVNKLTSILSSYEMSLFAGVQPHTLLLTNPFVEVGSLSVTRLSAIFHMHPGYQLCHIRLCSSSCYNTVTQGMVTICPSWLFATKQCVNILFGKSNESIIYFRKLAVYFIDSREACTKVMEFPNFLY